MRFKNSAILKLREKKNLIPMLMSQDQTLDNASKVYLFKPWRRPELLLREVIAALLAALLAFVLHTTYCAWKKGKPANIGVDISQVGQCCITSLKFALSMNMVIEF